jgi:hypothetical protein
VVGRRGDVYQEIGIRVSRLLARWTIGVPDVLANAHTETVLPPTKDHPIMGLSEIAIFIKNSVIGEKAFAVESVYLSALANSCSIIKVPLEQRTPNDCHDPSPSLLSNHAKGCLGSFEEMGLKKKIFRWIAG